ncbi:hypothetical protein Btru_048277 [Bulinus truncatus]|nr:hypothetical protein Btru_048277 [Bulinus truncatus]
MLPLETRESRKRATDNGISLNHFTLISNCQLSDSSKIFFFLHLKDIFEVQKMEVTDNKPTTLDVNTSRETQSDSFKQSPLCVKLHVYLINLIFNILVLLFDREYRWRERSESTHPQLPSKIKSLGIRLVTRTATGEKFRSSSVTKGLHTNRYELARLKHDSKSGTGVTEKSDVNGKENDTFEEDFVIIDNDIHTDQDLKSMMRFSVSSTLNFTSNSVSATSVNGGPGELIKVENDTISCGILKRNFFLFVLSLAYPLKHIEQLQRKKSTEKKITTFEAISSTEEHIGAIPIGDPEIDTRSKTSYQLENDNATDALVNSIQEMDGKGISMKKKLENKVKKLVGSFSFNGCNKDIDVLLIGKTGNGKSRTGNTILQKPIFAYVDSSNSVTQCVQHGSVQYDNRTIKVVDCPGLEDTGNMDDVEKATSYLIETMGDVVIKHPDGYHAFLLVVKYGGRFTKEDKCVIKTLKSIFGVEIISQFSIVLMTHGDNFSTENERNKSFKQWCSQQTGILKELMEECGNKVVLFDNVNNEKRDKQMKKLLKTINNLQSRGMRYNHDYFQRAVKNREYLLVEAKLPRILQETKKECSIISSELENLNKDTSEECIEKLKCLQNRVSEIKSKVLSEDNNTGALSQALEVIESSSKMIANRFQVIIAFRQKEADLKEERTSLLKLHNERMNSIIESYEEKRAKDAQRQEKEKQEMEKKWLEQEERKQADLKRMLDSVESERNSYQRKMEELEKECQVSKAEVKIQVEKQIDVLQSSMKGLMERETKERQAHQDELKRMRNEQQEELKRHNEKAQEELKNVTDELLTEQKKLVDKHTTEIEGLKNKEEKLIQEKDEAKIIYEKEKEENERLRKELDEKTGTFGKRLNNLCTGSILINRSEGFVQTNSSFDRDQCKMVIIGNNLTMVSGGADWGRPTTIWTTLTSPNVCSTL